MFIHSFVCRWNRLHPKPCINIQQFRQQTERPQVVVSLCSYNGSMTVAAYPGDKQGNAIATITARSMRHITNFPIHDYRDLDTQPPQR